MLEVRLYKMIFFTDIFFVLFPMETEILPIERKTMIRNRYNYLITSIQDTKGKEGPLRATKN